MKRLTFGFAMFCAVAFSHIKAETVLWYRFDGNGSVVTNLANPGVMDGTLKDITTFGNPYDLADNTKLVYTNLPTGWAKTAIPSTDQQFPVKKALSWTGPGAVVVNEEDISEKFKSMTSFTYEAFFKIPQAAIERAVSGGNAMFPIVHWGRDQGGGEIDGIMFSVFYNSNIPRIWARVSADQLDGVPATNKVVYPSITSSATKCLPISTNEWHHAAFTVNYDEATSKLRMALYLDYNEVSPSTTPDCLGIRQIKNPRHAMMVGANAFNSTGGGRYFIGEIAEVRISDTVLTIDDMLRPVPAGPVDDDTLMYLPLGDTPWFATNTLYNGFLNSPALNAAPTLKLTPSWFYSKNSTAISALGKAAVSYESTGEIVRDGLLASVSHDNTGSIRLSREESGEKYYGHTLRIPQGTPEIANVISNDFTIEWFFKTDKTMLNGDTKYSYTMLYDNWIKVMLNQSDHKLLTRLGSGTESGKYKDFTCSYRDYDDNQWHHYALVYDASNTTVAIWIDYTCYKRANIGGTPLTLKSSSSFLIGGASSDNQVFCGCLDDFRLTKRKLDVHEFLVTRPLATGANTNDLLRAHLEGNLSSGQDGAFIGEGVVKTVSGNAVTDASFSDINCFISSDSDERIKSTKALRLDGTTYLAFTNSSVFCGRDLTLEFFGKFSAFGNYSHLARMYKEGSYSSAYWSVYHANGGLRMKFYLSADGTGSNPEEVTMTIANSSDILSAANAWHHYAITISSDFSAVKTTMTFYVDYSEVAKETVDGLIALSETQNGYGLQFGHCSSTGSEGAGPITGLYDEIRLRPGVQPVSSFMRRENGSGFLLSVR